MNQSQWNSMSAKDKRSHLMVGTAKIEKQQGVDGRSKVGEAKVITMYSVTLSGVTLGQSSSMSKALRDTAEFLEALDIECEQESTSISTKE